MKKLLNTTLFLFTVLLLNSCSTSTFENDFSTLESNNFKARFVNETNEIVSFDVYDFDGLLINKSQNIKPGASVDMATLNSQEATFRISTSTSDRIVVMDIQDNNKYYVVLNEDKQVSTIQAAQL